MDLKRKASMVTPFSTRKGQKVLTMLKKNLLVLLLIVALALGLGLGAGLRTREPRFSKREIMYLRFPGDILMNMLTFLIVPLVISSLVSGLASLDTRTSGRIGLRAIVYYLTTTLMAVVLGIVLTVSIQPGIRGGKSEVPTDTTSRVVNTADTFLDLIRQSFPDNLVEMCFKKPVTLQIPRNSSSDENGTLSPTTSNDKNSDAANQTIYDPLVTKVDGMNVLGMVVFSIIFGIVVGRMGDRGRPIAELFASLCEATMQLVNLVIWYSPVGIMFLISAKVVEIDDLDRTFRQLGYYFLTVMAGLALHAFVTLPLVYFLVVRRNPFRYLVRLVEPLLTALATSSSSATMPVTMRCLEENLGIDKRVVKFVIPVGATVNMDGTALYEAVAVLFIGQMRGADLNFGNIVTISLTATAAAIGAAGVPQAGLVTMVIVLSAVGFPSDDVALILAVDWLLDRFRTAVNVLGDMFGAGIVHHLSKRDLETNHDVPGGSGDSSHDVSESHPLLSDGSDRRRYRSSEESNTAVGEHQSEI
ncbi:excitatory amino acid transporter 3-like isoform X2 [Dreissena polymorpha]|uniref:Amino acid transporter n=1 Tax=Dreissena polymorpha TaxID=45954 RepID=A0A9D4BKV9_DREPO|nr:excitatory amino acid transporter 3-like isoform X2 [Dreissena polymorpha]KAH3698589.1 hypothetical protein DPMN_086132 [Dreissena polymorpha]